MYVWMYVFLCKLKAYSSCMRTKNWKALTKIDVSNLKREHIFKSEKISKT